MNIIDTSLSDVKIIEPTVRKDHRGFFIETWNKYEFAEKISNLQFVQDNHSNSRKFVLRGLHYQIKKAQGKLVRVVKGRVFDVAVDLRRSSENFGKWVGVELSAENRRMLWVPPGFAHGFLALEDDTDFLYKCTDFYAPEHERTLAWNDPDIRIEWPLPEGEEPILSPKDAQGFPLKRADTYP